MSQILRRLKGYLDTLSRDQDVFNQRNWNVDTYAIVVVYKSQYFGHIYTWVSPVDPNLCFAMGIRGRVDGVFIKDNLDNVSAYLLEGVRRFALLKGCRTMIVTKALLVMEKILNKMRFQRVVVDKEVIGWSLTYSGLYPYAVECRDCYQQDLNHSFTPDVTVNFELVERFINKLDDDYEVTILPKDSLLYRGIRYYPSSNVWGNKYSNNNLYFGDFEDALLYSFLYAKKNPVCAKIVEYQTTKELKFINFTNPQNFQALFEKDLFDQESLNYFRYAFGWIPGSKTIKRFSDFDVDVVVAEFVVDKLPQYDGYIYYGDDFHMEIMISRPITSGVILTGKEWRHVSKYDRTAIYETYLGSLTGKKYDLKMYDRDLDSCQYIPNPNDPDDKLYFLQPIEQ